MAKRPRELTEKEALRLLFPKIMTPIVSSGPDQPLRPPATWRCWQKPRDQNDALNELDTQIEKLVKNSPKQFLADIRCPYWDARRWIVLSVRAGQFTIEKENLRRQQREHLKKCLADIADDRAGRPSLIRQLEELFFSTQNDDRFRAELVTPIPFGISRTDIISQNETFRRCNEDIDKIGAAIAALKDIASLAEIELRASTVPTSDLWLMGFIQCLGICYRKLSRKEPAIAPTGPFEEFVKNSYAALGGHPRDITVRILNNSVYAIKGRKGKSPLEARPEWDQFDPERRSDRPGVVVRPYDEFIQKQAQLMERWQNEMRQFYRAAQSDEPNQRAAAREFLDLTFEQAGPENRAFLESLGYKPPKLT